MAENKPEASGQKPAEIVSVDVRCCLPVATGKTPYVRMWYLKPRSRLVASPMLFGWN